MSIPISEGASSSRRHGILAICCLSLFLVSLDNNIVNIALPAMHRDIHAGVADLQWIVDAYTLVLASLLILGGSLGDRFGRKPVFMCGVAIFGLGSLLCSFAANPSQLIAARIFQAIGGAMLNPVAMSIITNTFTIPRERAMAIGMWGAVNGLGAAAGPLLGGMLVSSVGWRSVFWINVPIALAGFVLTYLFVPNSKAAKARRFDPIGQGAMLVFLSCTIGAIIEAPRRGWSAPLVMTLIAAAAMALGIWFFWAQRAAEPLIDLKYFKNPSFSAAILSAVMAFASLGGFMFLNALYLQNVRGMTPFEAGVTTLPVALMTIVFSTLSGRLVGSIGPRVPLVASGLATALAALLLLLMPADASIAYLIVTYTVFGIGCGLVNAPITNVAVSGLPPSQTGVAAGIASTGRQTGMSLGVAIAGAVIASGAAGNIGGSLVDAARPMWAIIVGFGLVICGLGWLIGARNSGVPAIDRIPLGGGD